MRKIKEVQIDCVNDLIVLTDENDHGHITTIKDGVKKINRYLESIPETKLDFPEISRYTKYGKLDVKLRINNAHTLVAVLAVLYIKGYKWYDSPEKADIPKEAPYLFVQNGEITYSVNQNTFDLFTGSEMPVTKVFELAIDMPFAPKTGEK